MNNNTKTIKFYNNLYKRIKEENLCVKDLRKIFKTAIKNDENINIKEFLNKYNLLCVKNKIIFLNSAELIQKLYQLSFEEDRGGFLQDSEIRKIVESFFEVRFDYANYQKLRNYIRSTYNMIYKPRLKRYEMKTYEFSKLDEVKFENDLNLSENKVLKLCKVLHVKK